MIPDTGLAPAHEAVVAGRGRTIALGNIRPRRPRAQTPENPVQHSPVVNACNTPYLVGKQRRDHRPLIIRQIKACHLQTPTVWKLESRFDKKGNPFYEFRT